MTIPDSAARIAGADHRSRREQDLILRATFLEDGRGLEAWRTWKLTVDLGGHLDLGSFRLLPELTRRLRRRGVEDPLLDRFAGISKKHWLANRLFFRDLELLVGHLRAHDVEVMAPAGIALALQHHPDHPLDPVADHAVLIRATHAVTAFEALQTAGWSPEPRIAASLLDAYVAARSWHAFRGPAAGRLRAQWHVLPQRATAMVDDGVWSRMCEVDVGDQTVTTACATDQLVQLCAQRVGRYMPPVFRRAVDVIMLLSACPSDIDWTHVAEMAGEPGLALPIRDTLTYLQDRLDEPVPADAFEGILRHPISRLERIEYDLTSVRPSWSGEVLGFWLDYRRSRSASLLVSGLRFPRFLQHYLTLQYLWQTPFGAMARAADHAREWTGRKVMRRQAAGDVPAPGR